MNNVFSFSQAKAIIRSELVLSWLTDGTLNIYSGVRPATPDTAIIDQLVLCSFVFKNPAGISSNGLFVASLPAQTLVLNSGYATWARIFDSSSATVADCDVGVQTSAALVKLNLLNLVKDSYIRILNFNLLES